MNENTPTQNEQLEEATKKAVDMILKNETLKNNILPIIYCLSYKYKDTSNADELISIMDIISAGDYLKHDIETAKALENELKETFSITLYHKITEISFRATRKEQAHVIKAIIGILYDFSKIKDKEVRIRKIENLKACLTGEAKNYDAFKRLLDNHKKVEDDIEVVMFYSDLTGILEATLGNIKDSEILYVHRNRKEAIDEYMKLQDDAYLKAVSVFLSNSSLTRANVKTPCYCIN